MSLRVFAFTTGWVTLPFGTFLDGEPGMLRIPLPAFLISHPRGTALFDTGPHLQMQQENYRDRLGGIAKTAIVECRPGDEISAHIRRVGVEPEDVDIIINSHLHWDHAGGNAQIPNARLIVQKPEWEAGNDPDLRVANNFNPDDYALGHDVVKVEGEHDVFGDGSVVCVPTYGHTPGHQSLRIRGRMYNHCLCGDACYLHRNVAEMRLPRRAYDRDQMLASLERLRDMQAAGTTLVYGHDPVAWETTRQAPSPLMEES